MLGERGGLDDEPEKSGMEVDEPPSPHQRTRDIDRSMDSRSWGVTFLDQIPNLWNHGKKKSDSHSSMGSSKPSARKPEKRSNSRTMHQEPVSQSYTQGYTLSQNTDLKKYGGTVFDENFHQENPSHALKRSLPIAINGASSYREPSRFDDTDDEDMHLDNQEGGNRNNECMSSSIRGNEKGKASNNLLKAPYLGSMSRSESYLTQNGAMAQLPPMSLSEFQGPPIDTTNYGSLRESHEVGRFLDGPASFRDRRSGQIRLLERGNYSRRNEMTQISIGERMQQFRKLRDIRKKNDTAPKQPKSSLSALMDSAPEDKGPNDTISPNYTISLNSLSETGIDTNRTFDGISGLPSTSLTGLEILRSSKSGLHAHRRSAGLTPLSQSIPPANVQKNSFQESFKPLARSSSDPTPNLRASGSGAPSTSRPTPPAPSDMEPFSLGGNPPETSRTPDGSQFAAAAVINDLCYFTLPSASGYSRDHAPFDMEE